MNHKSAHDGIQQKRAQLETELHISTDGHTCRPRRCSTSILNSADVFAVGSEHGRVHSQVVEHSITTNAPFDKASLKTSAICLQGRGNKND